MATSSGAPSQQQWQSRRHSQTLLTLGGSSHRVTRRKSMSSANASHRAAVAAAVQGASAKATGDLGRAKQASPDVLLAMNAATAAHASVVDEVATAEVMPKSASYKRRSHMLHEQAPWTTPATAKSGAKVRSRRASEGSQLRSGGSRRETGAELRCETCGKAYKHSSCLTKHLWEHTPEWSFTSKLLISKHQQVQLLEAASVLVTMNQDEDGTPDMNSHHSSASPGPSGSSASHDEMSSVHTTPPPPLDDEYVFPLSTREVRSAHKRRSSNGSAYSRSYQSQADTTTTGPSTPNLHRLSQASIDTKAIVGSYAGFGDEDEADLAAAVGLLSCGWGTPRSGPLTLGDDVPPVPPLPARFVNEKVNESAKGLDGAGEDDISRRHSTRLRNDDEDESVFGRMEE